MCHNSYPTTLPSEEETAQRLIKFLNRKAKQHQFIYHYTTFEKLKLILTNQCFKFSYGKSITQNDLHVQSGKGNDDIRKCLYFSCFTYRQNESIAMWKIYGKGDEDVIRIKIPMAKIKEWIRLIKAKKIPVISEYKQAEKNSLILQEITITDIAYVQGRKNSPMNIFWNNQCLYKNLSHGFDRIPSLTERLKNIAWEYEQETRIIIQCNQFYGEQSLTLPFRCDMLNDFTLMTGPKFKSFTQLQKFLDEQELSHLWNSNDEECKSLFKPNEINM